MTFDTLRVLNYPYSSSVNKASIFTDRTSDVLLEVFSQSMRWGILGKVPLLLLLWSILRFRGALSVSVVGRCGVSCDLLEQDAWRELKKHLDNGETSVIDLSRIAEVVNKAAAEAASLGADYVGIEHLVLALLRAQDESLSRLFSAHNLTYEGFKSVLTDTLKGPDFRP